MGKKKLGKLGWILSLVIFVALLNWGTVAWLNFNIVEWATFGVGWLAKVVYTIVALVGLSGLVNLIMKALK